MIFFALLIPTNVQYRKIRKKPRTLTVILLLNVVKERPYLPGKLVNKCPC